ncbi:DNA-binding protein RFXANK [Apiospora hydei]|uniref:DNA-binding protein RFXANK n=1 Tax=Apiospora hydei TaxID=1337664 RepID=A0ABR1W7C6_9PEZI
MDQTKDGLVIRDPQATGDEHPQLIPLYDRKHYPAGFYPVVRPYMKGGARHCDTDYLAQVLQAWSPEIDQDNAINAALFEAIYRGDEVAAQMLLDAGVSPRRPQRSDPQFTPLQAASQAGQLGMARRVWKLVVAARNGRPELVAFFLDVWGGWTAEERKGALDGAAWTRWDGCVDVLLAELTYEQKDLQVALEWAIRKRMILPEDETGCLRRKQLGDARLRQRRIICNLIDAGANPDGPGLWAKGGRLLLSAASQLDYTACMGALLEKGANASIQGSDGATALHVPLRKRSLVSHLGYQDTPQDRMAATQLLIDHGTSPDTANEAGETALHLAAQNGSFKQLQLCLAHTRLANDGVRRPNHRGESPLHYATASGREEIVEYLLAHGAADDVNRASSSGWTPLLCALSPSQGKSEEMAVRVAARLLTAGASARVVTAEVWSPLHAVGSWISGPAAEKALRYFAEPCYDPVARAQFVQLAHELIQRGAPLDIEPAFLRHSTIAPDKLDGVWGFRLQKLAESTKQEENAARSVKEEGAGSAVSDTTPLAWAIRTGAMDLVQVILDALGSSTGGRPT